MNTRRPVAALFIALALLGGGAGTLTACGSPSGGENSDTRNDGTTDDDSENTEGSDPGDPSQGNLPDNSDNDPDDNSDSERDEDEDAGGNN